MKTTTAVIQNISQTGYRRTMMRWISVILFMVMTLAGAASVFAAGAADSNTVLICRSAMYSPNDVEKAQALLLGFTVEVADDTAWNAKTTADFKTYKAIIIPDLKASSLPAIVANTKGTWGPAVTGNILVIGGDPEYHSIAGKPGATTLMYNGINFAANDPGKTGLYFASAYATDYASLSSFGTFVSISSSVETVHIVAVHPALTGLTDVNQSNWGTSTHAAFTSFPADFSVLAIQDGTGVGQPGYLTFADGHGGYPYLLAKGTGVQQVGLNIIKTAPSTTTAGANITYTITYGNSGTTNATNVVIKDPVPTGTTFVSATGGGTESGGIVTWNIGSLNGGTTGQTVQMVVTVNSGTTIINTNYTIQSTETASPIVGANVGTTVTSPPSYTVSTSSGTNGTLTCTPTTVNNGSTSSCTATGITGYYVSAMSGCGISYSNSTSTVTEHTVSTTAYNSNCTVSSTFAPRQYTVSTSITGSGSAPASTAVNYNGSTSILFTAVTGYHITNISGCGGTTYTPDYTVGTGGTATNSYTTGSITGDCSISATFAINKYNITATPDTHSKVDSYALNTPNAYSGLDYNASQSVTFTADTGYHLTGITNGCGGTASDTYPNANNSGWTTTATFTPSGTISGGVAPNCSITATTAINVYTITPSVGTAL